MRKIPNELRDTAITAFRERVCAKMGIVPFPHQREWWAASDGLTLTGQLTGPDDPSGLSVRLQDRSVEWWKGVARPAGRARVLADLGAFKVGKSFGAAMWAVGFAAVPHGRVSLVGLEYDICEPEFNYIVEALLSDSGMSMHPVSIQNRPRDGRMWLELENGCRFEAKSWERKDTLKGKEMDAYLFCEAFMLPGIECYTGIQQNLAARQGYALFPTTPDRPWVKELHNRAHGADKQYYDWHCTCNIPRSQNPMTFDQREMDLNDPLKGGLMTREQFSIAYLGKLGDFIGRCYNYQQGDATFTTKSHPLLWKDPDGPNSLSNLAIPDGWEVFGAADTGTYMSAVFIAFDPEGVAFIFYEQPNYDYTGGRLALDAASSIPKWATDVRNAMTVFGVRGLWADKNSQYKQELRNNHGIALLPANVNLQTRTEIGREYFNMGRVKLAPWLKILPWELENAHWPKEETLTGRFERVKQQDHTLDPAEHLLAKRPIGNYLEVAQATSWAQEQGYRTKKAGINPHLGGM